MHYIVVPHIVFLLRSRHINYKQESNLIFVKFPYFAAIETNLKTAYDQQYSCIVVYISHIRVVYYKAVERSK